MSTSEMITVRTRTCFLCGQTGSVSLPSEGLIAYNKGALIQEAFRNVIAPIREQFQSGIHPKCWDGWFGSSDDE